jgi:TetR/AcrR family transcriptional regulator, cholesterol catabolism regulator
VEIREKILVGTEQLFMRYGIKSITMDDIAKHLTVSKKTIYQHFSDKNALVECVMANHMIQEQNDVEQIRLDSVNAIEELYKLSKYIRGMMMEMNASLIMDLQKYHPNAWKYFQEHKHDCITTNILTNLKWGIEEGFFRSEINCDILALLRVEQIEIGFNPMTFPGTKYSMLDVQMELLNHFIYGIVTQKGLELYNEYITNNA